jgi:signal transduction histidine kinase
MTKIPDAFIDLCPFSIVLFDENLKVSLANKHFCELIGLDEQSVNALSQQQIDEIIASKSPYRTAWYADELDQDSYGQSQTRDIVFEHISGQLFQQIKVFVEENVGIGFFYVFKPVIESDDDTHINTLDISHSKHEILSTLTGVYGLSELLIHRDYDAFSRTRKLELIHQQSELLLHKMNNLFDLLEHQHSGC